MNDNDKRLIAIPFSGFYESAHTYFIDNAIEQIFSDDQGNDNTPDAFHMEFGYTNAMLNEYCKDYCENFSAWLDRETGIKIDLEFDHLYSPREYNFETDRIFAYISRQDITALAMAMDIRKFNEVIKERHSSRSGFISFYDTDLHEWFNKPLDQYDCNELETVLLAVIKTEDLEIDPFEIQEPSQCNGVFDSLVYDHMNDKARAMVNTFEESRHG